MGTPARHFDARAARRGADYDRETGERLPEIPTLIEAERRLLLADELLTELVENYAELAAAEAEARSVWEEHRDRFIVSIANTGERTSEDVRLARAKVARGRDGREGNDKYATYLTMRATSESCAKRISAVQSQLSALQTLIRGLRQVTGFDR